MKGSQATLLRAFYEAAQVERFHNAETLKPNLVGQHSWGVAMFVITMCDRAVRPELIFACLTHDMHERWSGDSPSPARRAIPQLQEGENIAEERFWSWTKGSVLAFEGAVRPELLDWELFWLRLGDAADSAWYSWREFHMGNRLMQPIAENLLRITTNMIRDNRDILVDAEGLEEACHQWITSIRLPESLTDLEEEF